MPLNTDKIELELGQIYETTDQGFSKQIIKIIYLPDDSPELVGTINDRGHKRFHDKDSIKRCIALGLWEPASDEAVEVIG